MSTLSTTNLKNPSSGSNNVVLNTDGTTTIAAPSNIIKSGTAVASTSGTSIDFTGIPSWAKRVTVMFNGVSTSGTSIIEVRIGTSSGIEATGYLGSATRFGSTTLSTGNSTTGFMINTDSASYLYHGSLAIKNISSNSWICDGVIGVSGSTTSFIVGSSKALSGTLDRVRITTVNGTDTFDAGSINILYEG
jgi:hypothetical protein